MTTALIIYLATSGVLAVLLLALFEAGARADEAARLNELIRWNEGND